MRLPSIFFDHLGENEEFISKKVSHQCKCEKLQVLLGTALEVFFKSRHIKTSAGHILRARGTPFYHGAFLAEDYTCNFLYFDDIGMGLLTLAKPTDPEVHSISLTSYPLATGPIWN